MWNEKEDIVHELLVAKAAVSVATLNGEGPLHLAAKRGYTGIALELLDSGAPIDMQDEVRN